jgi:lipopolysaccharide export system permease protein
MLGNNSELIVMCAAGVSVFQLAKGVLYAGIVLAVITFILGAYIGPIASKYAEVTRTIAIHHNSATIGNKENTIWLKQNNNFVHVTAKKNTKQFKNIKRYHFNDLKLDKITYAEKGRYQDAKHWEVKNIDTYTLNANKISHQHSQKQKWHAIISPEIVKVISKETQNLTLYSLYKIVNYSKAHGKSYAKPALQLWKMFFQPISVIILMLIAVPFSIGQARSSSMGLRFIIGFGIGFLFFLINQFFGPITRVYQIPPFLGASLPTLMFILLLVFLFYRTRD